MHLFFLFSLLPHRPNQISQLITSPYPVTLYTSLFPLHCRPSTPPKLPVLKTLSHLEILVFRTRLHLTHPFIGLHLAFLNIAIGRSLRHPAYLAGPFPTDLPAGRSPKAPSSRPARRRNFAVSFRLSAFTAPRSSPKRCSESI